jgi:hypothetical protein
MGEKGRRKEKRGKRKGRQPMCKVSFLFNLSSFLLREKQ